MKTQIFGEQKIGITKEGTDQMNWHAVMYVRIDIDTPVVLTCSTAPHSELQPHSSSICLAVVCHLSVQVAVSPANQ